MRFVDAGHAVSRLICAFFVAVPFVFAAGRLLAADAELGGRAPGPVIRCKSSPSTRQPNSLRTGKRETGRR